jgi:hypothetical protein
MYALRIGKFLFEFSKVENALNHFVATIINDRSDEIGYTIFSSLPYRSKVELLNRLCGQLLRATSSSNERRLLPLVRSLRELGEFRNSIANANWCSLDQKGYVRVRIESDYDGINLIRKRITLNILEREALKASKTTGKLEDFTEYIFMLN